ncbi:MAG: hypothetical protein ACR2HH_12425 [Chthoniobacterales bacterium]
MSSTLRGFFAALLFCSIALAAGLSASPQLHEWLHNFSPGTNHECVATLMSSGSAEHSGCDPIPAAPTPTPTVPAFRTQLFHGALALLEFARLEHAPPAHR